MKSRGRQGVAYVLDGSTGFSRASIMAARRRARSAAPRAAGTGAGAGVEAGSGVGGLAGEVSEGVFEGVGDVGVESGGERLSRDVNSRIWASIDSVRVVGRDRIRRIIPCRARRSCFRLAGSLL